MPNNNFKRWVWIWLFLTISMLCSSAMAGFLVLTRVVLWINGGDRIVRFNPLRETMIIISLVCIGLYVKYNKVLLKKIGW